MLTVHKQLWCLTQSLFLYSISSEFVALLRKVATSPLAIDIFNIPGIQKSMERFDNFFGKIEKVLGECLEKERSSFLRYCTVSLS